jgi:O-antigen/teichoic acid export membrane protein
MGNNIARDSTIGVITNGMLFVFNFLSSIITLRVLGPKQVGIFFIFLTVNQLAATVMSIGIPTANTMILGKSKYSFNQVNNNSLLVSGIVGLFCILTYLLCRQWIHSYLVKDMEPELILLSIILVPFALYGGVWNAMMIGINKIMTLNKFLFWQGLASLILVAVFLLFIRQDIYGAVAAWTLVTVFSPVGMILIGNRIERFRFEYNAPLLRESLSFGFKVHLGGIATMIWQRIDAFFLNYYHGKTSVGYYSLAVNLTELLWKITIPVANAVNSTITGSEKKSAGDMTTKVIRHVAFILIILGIGLCVFSPFLITLVYGSSFLPAVKPLLILMAGTIGVGVVMITAIFFANTLDKPLFLSMLAWINAMVNVVLCFVFIPRFAENGAAWASSLTYICGMLIVLFSLKKELGVNIREIIVLKKDDLRDYLYFWHAIKSVSFKR